MTLRDYYRRLDAEAREQFAARAGTTRPYVEVHLLPRRKIPRPDLMRRLADATQGAVGLGDMLNHFYSRPSSSLRESIHEQTTTNPY